MRVRAATIDLHLPRPLSGAAARLRHEVERGFLAAVLDSCERTVRTRFGGEAIVCLRRLEVAWTVGAGELHAARVTRALGEELAQAVMAELDRLPAVDRLLPRPDGRAAIFENATHRAAARLVTDASEQATWLFGAAAAPEVSFAAALDGGAASLAALLGWLDRLWREVPATEARIVAVEELAIAPALLRAASAVLPASQWPVRESTRAALCRRAAAARSSSDRQDLAARPGTTAIVPGAPPTTDAGAGAAQGRGVAGAGAAQGRGVAATIAPRRFESAGDGNAPANEVSARSPAQSKGSSASAPTTEPPSLIELQAAMAPVASTEWAGVFYLAGGAIETGLAEQLFCAGVLEGLLLAAAVTLLIAPATAHDPAPYVLGGSSAARAAALVVAPWAAAEVARNLPGSIAQWAARRRGSATHVPARLAELGAALHRLAPDATPATELTRTAAAALWLAFEERLGDELTLPALQEYLRLPGSIVHDDTCITVAIPLTFVDVRLRLAGLDFSPGFLPWLQRRLELSFVE